MEGNPRRHQRIISSFKIGVSDPSLSYVWQTVRVWIVPCFLEYFTFRFPLGREKQR